MIFQKQHQIDSSEVHELHSRLVEDASSTGDKWMRPAISRGKAELTMLIVAVALASGACIGRWWLLPRGSNRFVAADACRP